MRTRMPQRLAPVSIVDRFFNDLPEVLTFERDDEIRVEEERQDNALVIRADIPGVDPENDVEIRVDDGTLVIKAERQSKTETKDKGFYRSEIRYGSFERRLPLPTGATDDDVKATYHDGVLEVTVPIAPPSDSSKRVPIVHQ